LDIRTVPLAELRMRFAAGGEPVSEGLLEALRGDARAGAHALARELERRRGREERERVRTAAMYRHERRFAARGVSAVAGVDEVGMGPLAGPVVAAAVVLPADAALEGLRDSKQLSRAARERLAKLVHDRAVAVSIAEAAPAEIDRINIYQAGLLAMRRAVERLRRPPGQLLVDARRIPGLRAPQLAIVKGDASVASIAAASIVAKVFRDARMQELDAAFPGYGFARNAGYGTPEHLAALRACGPTSVHRRSFTPVAEAAEATCRTP
jgi:ribonuclease HII